MKFLTLSTIVLLLLNQSSAQERGVANGVQANPAAIVREIKGTCYVRKNGAAQPRKLKTNQKIEAGEELQCDAKGKVVIRFQNSGSVKEVTTTSPNWFLVPNVPSGVTKSAFKPASRSKGDFPPPLVQPIAASESNTAASEPNASAATDEVADYWTTRKKYFLIIAVSPSQIYKADEFTKTDSNALSSTLKSFGYQELIVLKGQQPTQDNVVSALQKIRELSEDALVLVYYSGHAVTDGRDLWLQLSGQQAVGDHRGLSVTDLIGSARGDSFKGELAIVLDTCYSGQGLRSSRLSLQDIENTTIFASSSAYQPSYTKTLPSGVEISAFTYHLIQGLASDFSRVDGDDDGIVEYVDLQRYISNKLIEDYADESLPGQMKPQMLGHAQRGWIAYDAKVVKNVNTEARRSLTLETNSTLHDPEKYADTLPDPLPDNASPYLKAIEALDDEDYERAWMLLQEAENEKSVSLAQINWARANVKLGQLQPGPARMWLQRTLDSTRKPPPDLLFNAGVLNLIVGHLVKAEQFFKQGLAAGVGNSTVDSQVIDSLFALTIINFVQGDRKDVELYSGQLRAIGPKVLDEHEKGSSSLLNMIDVFSSLLSENSDSALQALHKLKSSLKTDESWSSHLDTLIDLAERALRSSEDTDSVPVAVTLSEKDLQEWRDSLSKKDVAALSMVLLKVQMAASSPGGREALASGEVKDLLKKSIEFTSQPRQRKITVTDASGTREVDLEASPDSDAMENGQILTLLANIHSAKADFTEAENLYKQSMAVFRGLPGGNFLAFQSIIGLSNLYQSNGRWEDAARLFRKLLDDLDEPFGEINWLSLMMHGELAEVYQGGERWEEAEASYRKSLEIALTLFGSSSLITDLCRNNLSEFLVSRNRHADAAQLLEEMIAIVESRRDTWPVMIRDTLGDGYFQLGKSYYLLRRFELADAALIKAFDFVSKRDDVSEAFECLHWRWATLETLKKTAQSQEVGRELVKLVNAEISKKKPSAKLGNTLISTAVWFRDSNEVAKAEELLQLGLKLQQKVYGLDAGEVAEMRMQLGYLALFKQSFGTAHNELRIAENMFRKISPVPSDRLADALLHMGYASFQKQDFTLALTELQEALKLATPPLNDSISLRIAYVERAMGQLGLARSRLLSLVPTAEPGDLDGRLNQASIFLQLTAVSRLQNAGTETDKWLERAETVLANTDRNEAAPLLVRLQYEQALRELERGRLKQGEQLLKEVIEKGRTTPWMDWLVWADSMDRYAAFLRPRGKEKEAAELEEEAKNVRDRLKL